MISLVTKIHNILKKIQLNKNFAYYYIAANIIQLNNLIIVLFMHFRLHKGIRRIYNDSSTENIKKRHTTLLLIQLGSERLREDKINKMKKTQKLIVLG